MLKKQSYLSKKSIIEYSVYSKFFNKSTKKLLLNNISFVDLLKLFNKSLLGYYCWFNYLYTKNNFDQLVNENRFIIIKQKKVYRNRKPWFFFYNYFYWQDINFMHKAVFSYDGEDEINDNNIVEEIPLSKELVTNILRVLNIIEIPSKYRNKKYMASLVPSRPNLFKKYNLNYVFSKKLRFINAKVRIGSYLHVFYYKSFDKFFESSFNERMISKRLLYPFLFWYFIFFNIFFIYYIKILFNIWCRFFFCIFFNIQEISYYFCFFKYKINLYKFIYIIESFNIKNIIMNKKQLYFIHNYIFLNKFDNIWIKKFGSLDFDYLYDNLSLYKIKFQRKVFKYINKQKYFKVFLLNAYNRAFGRLWKLNQYVRLNFKEPFSEKPIRKWWYTFYNRAGRLDNRLTKLDDRLTSYSFLNYNVVWRFFRNYYLKNDPKYLPKFDKKKEEDFGVIDEREIKRELRKLLKAEARRLIFRHVPILKSYYKQKKDAYFANRVFDKKPPVLKDHELRTILNLKFHGNLGFLLKEMASLRY